MRQKREQFRIRIDRVGYLRRGSDVVRFESLDLTDKGIGLRTDLSVVSGEELELTFELTNTCSIHCTIEVTHTAPPDLGGRITAISPEHQQHLLRFIEQLITMNLTGF